MTAKVNMQDRKDFDKFTKFFVYKSIQIIVQARLGEKIRTKSKPYSSGADWFNLAVTDNNEVQTEAKKIISNQTSTLGQNVCVEISLRTAEGDQMVLEIWYITLDPNICDISAKMSQTGYARMSIALKSLLNVSRVTPAYKLSRRQGNCDYVICYRIYLGDPQFYILGEGCQKSKVGSVPTPYGTIGIHLAYRTKLLISPQNTHRDVPFEVKDDHFKQDNSSGSGRPTTPKPCSYGYRRQSTSDTDSAGQSEESCTTTFSTSPGDYSRGVVSPAPHHQSQPIKIHVPGTSSPIHDKFPDFKTQSAPEKPYTLRDCHRVGAFVQHFADTKQNDADDVPFLSLLQKNKQDRSDKPDGGKLVSSKGTSSTKTESSKDSESALSESKASTSSQVSAPDDFVMVELKTPFAGADANSDLGKFYRECQNAPALTSCEEEQTIPEALEQITTQLEMFETNLKDFDCFVSELNVESDSEHKGIREFEVS